MLNKENMNIAIAGASGFIGQSLITWILAHTDHNIIALSRHDKTSNEPRLKWKTCDLFSLLAVEEALQEVDCAYYLVHSMLPSAMLEQGDFADYDLLLADNFARAAQKNKLKQIIYLGGIIPDTQKLSRHLESRKEVEDIFKNKTFFATILRSGLILGQNGSSYMILQNLINRLPVLICPKWTNTLMSPIADGDAISALGSSLNNDKCFNKTYDIGSGTNISYLDMMRTLAQEMGLKRFFLFIPFNFIFLSRLWVRLVSGSSKELVYPLLNSLKHPMIASTKNYFPYFPHKTTDNRMALRKAITVISNKKDQTKSLKLKLVRSIQRMSLPLNKSAIWVAHEYMRWLPRFLFPFLIAHVENFVITFCLFHKKIKLLELTYSEGRSTTDRALFYITGGLLSASSRKGRFEFRETMDRKFIITAIHDFKPTLPWHIYRFTQAIVHLWVMNGFKKHLARLSKHE